MQVLAAISAWSVLAFAFLLFIVQVVAREFGFWLGRRSAATTSTHVEGVSVMVGGLLALLAFVLALTLSFASARFDERRLGSLAEANAIGTAWLRADGLGNPRGDEIARLLKEYAGLRDRYIEVGHDQEKVKEIDARTSTLQNEIWGNVTAVTRQRADAIAGQLAAAVNEVFDTTTAERFAYTYKFPPQIIWLLFLLALLSMGGVGYQLGLRGKPLRLIATLLTLTWTVVIVDILDLGTPRIGTFRTGTAVYEWTLSGMQAPIPQPALPATAPK